MSNIYFSRLGNSLNPVQALKQHCDKVRLPLPLWEFEQVSISPPKWKATVRLNLEGIDSPNNQPGLGENLSEVFYSKAIGRQKKLGQLMQRNRIILGSEFGIGHTKQKAKAAAAWKLIKKLKAKGLMWYQITKSDLY